MGNLINLLLLSLLGSVLGLSGGLLLLFNKRISKVLEEYSIPFAAGVLITVSLVGLLPEVFESGGEQAFLVVLASFFAAYLFEHVFFRIHHHDHGDQHKQSKLSTSSLLVIFGDSIHNFIDGVAIGASFGISPGLGFITALSTFLHEVPHEVSDFGILLKAGWKKKNIILANLFSAMVTIVGSFGAYTYSTSEVFNSIFLAVSAGIFLYLGATDFLPHIHEKSKSSAKTVVPLALGSILILFTLLLIPHSG